MREISLVKMGHPRLDIDRVITIINNNQNQYKLIYQDSIPNLGNSDLDDFSYSDDKLFTIIGPHTRGRDITIGITSVPLQNNWFLRPNHDRSVIIITIFEADSLIADAKRTIEEYVVYQVLIAILTSDYYKRSGIQPSERLLHDDCRGCLFDFCGNKMEIVAGLQKLDIDTQCRGILLEGNVPNEKVNAVLSVLKYIRKPSINKTIYSVKRSPYLTMIFGIGVGIFINMISQVLMAGKSLLFGIILALSCTIGVIFVKYLYDIVLWRKD